MKNSGHSAHVNALQMSDCHDPHYSSLVFEVSELQEILGVVFLQVDSKLWVEYGPHAPCDTLLLNELGHAICYALCKARRCLYLDLEPNTAVVLGLWDTVLTARATGTCWQRKTPPRPCCLPCMPSIMLTKTNAALPRCW